MNSPTVRAVTPLTFTGSAPQGLPYIIRAWSGFLLRCFGFRGSQDGDAIVLHDRRIRSGEPGGIFVSVALADGLVLDGRGAGPAPPRPPAPAQ